MQAVPLVFLGGLLGLAVADKLGVRALWSTRCLYSEATSCGALLAGKLLLCVLYPLAHRCTGGGGVTDPHPPLHPPQRTLFACVGTAPGICCGVVSAPAF
jgi:hypothetical protein